MPLDKQVLAVPFTGGADQHTDDHWVAPGRLLLAENAVYRKRNRVSLRPGFAALGDLDLAGQTLGRGDALGAFNGELLKFAGASLYSYSPGVKRYLAKGSLTPLVIRGRSVAQGTASQQMPDSATAAGQTLFAWEDGRGGVRCSVMDDASGVLLLADVSVAAAGVGPRVAMCRNALVVVYRVAGTLRSRVYQPGSGTLGAEQTIASDARTTDCWSDTVYAGAESIIVYRSATGTIKAAYLLATGLLATIGSVYPAAASIAEDPENLLTALFDRSSGLLWVIWHHSTNGLRAVALDGAFNALVQPTTLDSDAGTSRNAAGSISGADTATLFYERVPSDSNSYNQSIRSVTVSLPSATAQSAASTAVTVATDEIALPAHGFATRQQVRFTTTGTDIGGLSAGSDYFVLVVSADAIRLCISPEAAGAGTYITLSSQGSGTHTFTPAGLPGAHSVFLRSVGLASKLFSEGGLDYLTVVHDSALQATYFIVDSSGQVMGKARATRAGGLTAAPGLPSVVSGEASVHRFAGLSKNALLSQGGDQFTLSGVYEVTMDFTRSPQHYSAQLGQNLHITGGAVYSYDGAAATEHGFHLYPENVSAVAAGTGGSMSDGTYLYSVLYEWVDARGQVHRSFPSVGLSVTLSAATATQQVTLTVPTLRLTAKTAPRPEVSLVVYRTQAGLETYHRVSAVTAPTLNDPSVDALSIVDTLSDASLAGNEFLYTGGGVLGNDAPPGCSLVAVSKRRVFLAGLEDGGVIWPSKQLVPGEAVAFSASLAIRLGADGARETAIAVMDEHLVVFREGRIERVPGDGPDDTGATGSGDFGTPQLVTPDVGCSNAASVVLAPDGLMFQSDKGIWLLKRDFTVEYVGAAVEDLVAAQSITAAVLMKDTSEVAFVTVEGTLLLYNYLFGQWSTARPLPCDGATAWNGALHILRTDGVVWGATKDAYSDDGRAIVPKWRLPWLRVSELEGFQRVYKVLLLGHKRGEHRLTLKAAFDYQGFFSGEAVLDTAVALDQSAWGDAADWGGDAQWGGASDGVYQVEYRLPRQKCQAVQIEIEGHPSGAANEMFDISAISLLVGLKHGTRPLSPLKKAV